ncbi:hypothetical protein CYL16_28480 [Mycobacterium sp. EPG1]|nr:hypothetical protein CYL16_28480 [Mycobacterium sp. EPG1]
MRQQALRPVGGWPSPVGVVERVVALLWWWGVVFDSWIVVASIEMMACMRSCPSLGGGFSCAGCCFM